jgi:predicted RND superfamily exporter protein
LGTFFLAACAMAQILSAFFTANVIYRFLWPSSDGFGFEFFTLFCGLAMFVIMGIGADNVFVYYGTWTGSKFHDFPSGADRVSHVYGHAVNAMFVTSTTTCISFFSNMSSSFVGVRAFGIFAGLLVLVNFLMVGTFFPAAVLYYEKSWQNTKFLFGIFDGVYDLIYSKFAKKEAAKGEDEEEKDGVNW